jgi:hypothetical protein
LMVGGGMMNKLIIIIDRIDVLSLDKDINVFQFNPNEAHISGATNYFERDAIALRLFHDEFDKVGEGEPIPPLYYSTARKRYPFLFVNTNPILYRRF